MNTFLTNEYTEVIQKLIKEVVNDPSTYIGSKYLPSIAIPVNKVRTEVIEASGGTTSEHSPGSNVKYIQSFGTRVQEYQPPFYKEAIHYNERDILFLRELGQNGRNQRGIEQYIDLAIDRLNRRIEARIELQRWTTIFNGGFSYMGKTISFGIPSGNQETPVGQGWNTGSLANNSADPLADLNYWLNGGSSPFRKYTITKIISNDNTARWFLTNTNVRNYITSYGANPKIDSYSMNKVIQFIIPGCPEWEIYKGWYQSESVVNGKLTVSDAIRMIPDGYIFFEASLPGGDKIGEFMQTNHLASGSIKEPGNGKFLVVDDNTAPGTKGGPGNPYLDLIGGVYGGVKLDRAFDVLTANVNS